MSGKLWMQCPGCFGADLVEDGRPDCYIECETCGEKWTVIDLRDGPKGRGSLITDRGCLELRAPQPQDNEGRYREALRYIAGEDVAGFAAHMRPQEVARAALREETP